MVCTIFIFINDTRDSICAIQTVLPVFDSNIGTRVLTQRSIFAVFTRFANDGDASGFAILTICTRLSTGYQILTHLQIINLLAVNVFHSHRKVAGSDVTS